MEVLLVVHRVIVHRRDFTLRVHVAPRLTAHRSQVPHVTVG
jgi:hypothetical protein